LTALSEQCWDLPLMMDVDSQVENVLQKTKKGDQNALEWKFRLDKDMKVSDLFLGVVLEKVQQGSSDAPGQQQNQQEGFMENSTTLPPPPHFNLTCHVGETRNSFGMWCFDSSVWHANKRMQRRRRVTSASSIQQTNSANPSQQSDDTMQEHDANSAPQRDTKPLEQLIDCSTALGGGLYERVSRGSQISMKLERCNNAVTLEQPQKDNQPAPVHRFNLLWQVNNGEWFGFGDGSTADAIDFSTLSESSTISDNEQLPLYRLRVAVSFGMSGLQVSALT